MNPSFIRLLVASLVFTATVATGADQPKVAPAAAASETTLKTELTTLIEKVQRKAATGPVNEAGLQAELATFDRLLVDYKTSSGDELAMVHIYKAMLYLQLLEDADKAKATLVRLKQDIPKAKQIEEVNQMLEVIAKQQEAAKIQESLKTGMPFPDFDEKDLDGNPVSVARLKGNVVLVDFWATWCGPCVEEMPRVIALHKKYHSKGFEVVGVSLDRDEAQLKAFLDKNKMTWPQIFDGKFWDSKLAGVYGVTGIPFTILIDGEGKIVGKNLRGAELDAALVRLLGP